VIATGRQESVRPFHELCALGMTGGWGGIDWRGEGLGETGHRADSVPRWCRIDPAISSQRRWNAAGRSH